MLLARKFPSRDSRSLGHGYCPATHRRSSRPPHVERLEERQLLSGFGPADGAYMVEAWNGIYTDVKLQPGDQKIVAAGTVAGGGVALARYDSAGNPDVNYGTGGLSTPNGLGIETGSLVLQSDGKAVVALDHPSNGYYYVGAGRININGSVDSSFGTGGWNGVNVGPYNLSIPAGVGLTSTGKVVVDGARYNWTGSSFARSAVLAGFKADGSLDSGKGGFGDVGKGGQPTGSAFATFGGYGGFNSLVVQPDDKVVAVGYFNTQVATAGQLLVARYTAGVLDKTFNGTGYSTLSLPGVTYTAILNSRNDVALQSDGKIVAVSSTYAPDGSTGTLVARYTVGGTLDTTFGGGNGYVRLATGTSYGGQDVVIQPLDAKIVAVSSVAVTRLNTDGTLDGTFGTGGVKLVSAGPNFHVQGVALQSGGSIIVAGYEGTTSATQHPALMRFYGGATPSAPQVFSVVSGSAGVTQVTGRFQNMGAFDTGGATASLSADVAGVSTASVLKRDPRPASTAFALPTPRRTAAAHPTTVAPGPIFVPLVLDDHPFLDTLIAGKRRRSG